jgi:hypothetical protein
MTTMTGITNKAEEFAKMAKRFGRRGKNLLRMKR